MSCQSSNAPACMHATRWMVREGCSHPRLPCPLFLGPACERSPSYKQGKERQRKGGWEGWGETGGCILHTVHLYLCLPRGCTFSAVPKEWLCFARAGTACFRASLPHFLKTLSSQQTRRCCIIACMHATFHFISELETNSFQAHVPCKGTPPSIPSSSSSRAAHHETQGH